MNKNEIFEFGKLMTCTGELYGRAISKPLTKLYWQALLKFDLTAIRQAFDAHVKNTETGQYFPKPADLIRILEGSGDDKAMAAWAKVLKAIQSVGAYSSIVFDDVLIHATLEQMGGWIKLCRYNCHDLQFRANEFQKFYSAALRQTPEHYPNYFAGITEAANSSNGYKAPPPVLFGDKQLADKIFQRGTTSRKLIHAQQNVVDKNAFAQYRLMRKHPESKHEEFTQDNKG